MHWGSFFIGLGLGLSTFVAAGIYVGIQLLKDIGNS